MDLFFPSCQKRSFVNKLYPAVVIMAYLWNSKLENERDFAQNVWMLYFISSLEHNMQVFYGSHG
jgi:hypothetical protein